MDAVEGDRPPVATDALSGVDFQRLRNAYWKHVPAEELAGRSAADLSDAARSHLALAVQRPQGTAGVRVHTPDPYRDGWSAEGRSVVEIVTDDMPFLVDSVMAALTNLELDIYLVVHPQIVVTRDVAGDLLGIPEQGPDRVGCAESWMHLEIDRIADDAQTVEVEQTLRRVLHDVRDAVEDWQKMGEAALRAADDLLGPAGVPGPDTDPELLEAWDLLCWLADNHFTFLGYREYELVAENGQDFLRGVPGSGLGIMRGDLARSRSFDSLTPEARALARDSRPLIITKATSRSTVHRPGYLDYVGVKRFDEDGNVIGERRFVGLFSRAAYTESVARVPVLRRKFEAVFERTGFAPNSYSGRDLVEIIETYPRDELFATPTDQLYQVLLAVLHLKERKQLRLFLRRDDYDRYVSALIYLPRDRYNTENRIKIEKILLRELGGVNLDYTSRVTESVLARLHFIVHIDPTVARERPQPDAARIEELLVTATRTWREALREALEERFDEHQAAVLTQRYAEAFPAGYREENSARAAVYDLGRLERLAPDSISVRLYETRPAESSARRFSLYRRGKALSLSEVLPVLQHLGVEVTDEQPYHVEGPYLDERWIYDFGLRVDATAQPCAAVGAPFEETFLAVRAGQAESDGFNRLVQCAALTWRQVSVVRAYAKYLRQAGSTFGQEYVEQAVAANPDIARMLVRLFEAKFDPELGAASSPERVEVVDALSGDVLSALDAVASLDADRILRSLFALIRATLRTNHFLPRSADGDPRPALAIKLDPRQLPELPTPRPRFEIWVYSPAVEGVHLRFGPVARGGLRWSDRREDFRTEILGLVKAQMVKNAVIVPVGAKGGFVVKRPPAGTGTPDADREALAAEGVACYRSYVNALLEVTDNLREGSVVPAQHVVRHDGEDAYLVVAADKGTAAFSDIANEISLSRGFWLGDAFASGGSVGYDHKAMGITARGAWESVKRHFRELGRDCQRQDFTCVGIGDMSGDVFGNGMLLSRHTRLVAAFDHRHVFLDPNPDANSSFAERQRIFGLPRSSWADYDRELISSGGGVYPRTAKSIPISSQVRAALGIAPAGDGSEVTALTPSELIRAILLAPVDLLWNGGIGTYVKGSSETNLQVGDKANDATRVDGSELRAAVVGEGGNLGFTQRGRIEYALAGGRINTDAIDNSAGVDTSDHEVNIKILLDHGPPAQTNRAALLASMTDEVAGLVLADNYAQNVALANSTTLAPALLNAHARLIRALEKAELLDRALEFLPSDREMAARAADGRGLTTPELSVLLAYAKIALYAELSITDLPDSTALQPVAVNYFPSVLHTDYIHAVARHPLRREIITTVVVNDLVNDAGISFVHRVHEETVAPAVDIVRAWLVARDAFDLAPYGDRVAALDTSVTAEVLTGMRLAARKLAERATRWLLAKRRPPLDIVAELKLFSTAVSEVLVLLPAAVRGSDAEAFSSECKRLVEAGVPAALAERTAAMELAPAALDIVEVARASGAGLTEVTAMHFLLAEELQISTLRAAVNALPRDDRWKASARAGLREDLLATHAALTAEVLASGEERDSAEQRLVVWRTATGQAVDHALAVLDEMAAGQEPDLGTASVALRALRGMLGSTLI